MDIEAAYVSSASPQQAQLKQHVSHLSINNMGRKISRLEQNFIKTQQAFREVQGDMERLQDDFVLISSTMALNKNAALLEARKEDIKAAQAWFPFTREPHTFASEHNYSKASSFGTTAEQLYLYQDSLGMLIETVADASRAFRRMIDFTDDMKGDLAGLDIVA